MPFSRQLLFWPYDFLYKFSSLASDGHHHRVPFALIPFFSWLTGGTPCTKCCSNFNFGELSGLYVTPLEWPLILRTPSILAPLPFNFSSGAHQNTLQLSPWADPVRLLSLTSKYTRRSLSTILLELKNDPPLLQFFNWDVWDYITMSSNIILLVLMNNHHIVGGNAECCLFNLLESTALLAVHTSHSNALTD